MHPTSIQGFLGIGTMRWEMAKEVVCHARDYLKISKGLQVLRQLNAEAVGLQVTFRVVFRVLQCHYCGHLPG